MPFLQVVVLNPPKFLLAIDLIIIGYITIAKIYQEQKRNGSQVALLKKLTGDTTTGQSKSQLTATLSLNIFFFFGEPLFCQIRFLGSEALKSFPFFLAFFCSCRCCASFLPTSTIVLSFCLIPCCMNKEVLNSFSKFCSYMLMITPLSKPEALCFHC